MSAEPISELKEPEDDRSDAGPGERDLEDAALTTDADDYFTELDREAEENGSPRGRIIVETWPEFRDSAETEPHVTEEEQEALDEELADHRWDALDPREAVIPAIRGSFADRVASRRVDLLQRIRDGIPEAAYLPASTGMLRAGKRHQWVAPKKVGKSISALVHAVDMVLAGACVVIFDRENGSNLYCDRLEQIITARGLDERQQTKLAAQIAYFEFPRFRDTDESDLVALCAGADLVIFDSQRMFLSDLGLEESVNDDYAAFMAALVDPLFRAGIATLILDNSGHQDPKRSRGASAKGDLNEILFAVETVERFTEDATGLARLEITDSRFGNSGRWELEIGGGVFGSWRRIDDGTDDQAAGFRPTGLMERASIFLELCSDPPTRRTITDEIGGKGRYARIAIECLIREGYARGAKGQGVESIKPYRKADDPLAEAGRSG